MELTSLSFAILSAYLYGGKALGMTYKMPVFPTLIVLLCVLVSEAANLEDERVCPALDYWNQNLPNTSVPNALRQAICPHTIADHQLEDVKAGDVSISSQKYIVPGGGDLTIYGHKYITPQVGDVSISSHNYIPPQVADAFISSYNYIPFRGGDVTIYGHKYITPQVGDVSISTHNYIPPQEGDVTIYNHKYITPQVRDVSISSHKYIPLREGDATINSQNGETRFCATSMESMIDYSTAKLGSNDLNVLVTNLPINFNSENHQYSVTALFAETNSSSKHVICHSLMYPYGIYMCHEAKGTEIFEISLSGPGTYGSSIPMKAICHADTSGWNPEHAAFVALNVKPGEEGICHFMLEGTIAWLLAN
ncbi:uncharacterized protein LOC131049716 [Cryptomeria japonica]|uniref:uncharacterized protein LOC131049716 n=1 Tax=Cryptomeria japonica TaxID=3369 RepID=UPI0025AD45A8|nr:uncharacterized protein LOC131049716 [Cryptomeria japonica]